MIQSPRDAFLDMPERPVIACYVINLAHDRARLDGMSKSLSSLGIPFKRHPAVNGKRHESFIRRSLGQRFFSHEKGRDLTAGEIGCALSHISACRRMLREGEKKAIILEDDALFAPEFAGFYKEHLSAMLDRFDIIKMEGIFYDHTTVEGAVLETAGAAQLVLPLRPSLGAAAYAVNRRGAQRLLAALRKVDDPFDIRLVQYERHHARYAELRPMLARQDTVPSSLEVDRARVESVELDRSPSTLTKVAKTVRFLSRATGRLSILLVSVMFSGLRRRTTRSGR